jgi:tRNA pseudouridine55 synthase
MSRVKSRPIHGVLLLDKPYGRSSNAALQKARWLLNAPKAGHTGVLDPLATGLLPLCFGEATKFAQWLLDADKSYTATLGLGQTTTTGDLEGDIVLTRPVSVTESQLSVVLEGFLGAQQQMPPMYSALKHQGKALYEYARAGVHVERKPRDIVIHRLQSLGLEANQLTISVDCSKGTYIRVLAEDIGEALGCGAHLKALRRTATAGFQLDEAITLEELENLEPAQREAALQPMDILVQHLPRCDVSLADAMVLQHGQTVQNPLKNEIIEIVRVYDAASRFIGVCHAYPSAQLQACRLLSTAT